MLAVLTPELDQGDGWPAAFRWLAQRSEKLSSRQRLAWIAAELVQPVSPENAPLNGVQHGYRLMSRRRLACPATTTRAARLQREARG